MNTAEAAPPVIPYRGLSPFLRLSIAGADLQPIAQELLALAGTNDTDANLWMNLAIALQSLGQRDIGLSIQQQALAMRRIYRIPARQQPVALRVLMLMVPGDLSANTPLECLLEDCDVELIQYFVTPGADPLALPIPEHDVLLVALGEADANHPILDALTHRLADWPRPVINPPQHIPATNRARASELLHDIPGVLIPQTRYTSRATLIDIAAGRSNLPELAGGCDYPIILRPVDSQAGRDLERIATPAEIATYLEHVEDEAFFLARFVDYSGTDGLFRKYRVALIDGQAYASHMGVSSHWMVHYVNAGMYEDAWKRAEEAAFMEHFGEFAQRHRPALDEIQRRIGLDYLCIDCAETRDGRLMIFEVDHVMVVHAMDPEDLFPYKQVYMQKIRDGFRDYLLRRIAATADMARSLDETGQ